MEYNFREIEQKWQKTWAAEKTYHVEADATKEKFYVLNMFPYPSGAGLHVGHPLGYIASDIYARYKRSCGYNVLNPMGYDAYGLPAEQYAIQTGQHPAVTTVKNIARYREQLDKIGFCFDWDREVRTCDASYYHWTQWAFLQMFNSYYSNTEAKARPIQELIAHFEQQGTEGLDVAQGEELAFTAEEWKQMDAVKQQQVLMNYRIAYLGETMVNWCPKLGTVLANDEVVDGVSERGGYPVVQKKMMQWCLRVSAYAQRLLEGLETIDWSDSIKETQRNWIGRSEGTEMEFAVKDSDVTFTIFTTRADTIFGVTFMVLAPESELVAPNDAAVVCVFHSQSPLLVLLYQAGAAKSTKAENLCRTFCLPPKETARFNWCFPEPASQRDWRTARSLVFMRASGTANNCRGSFFKGFFCQPGVFCVSTMILQFCEAFGNAFAIPVVFLFIFLVESLP